MADKLTYTIVNSQLVQLERETEYDGQPAVVKFQRAVIESVPADHSGGTFTMTLPPEKLEDYPEGAEITLMVKVTAPPAAEEGN